MVPDEETPGPDSEYRVRVPGAAELPVGETRAFSYERAGKALEGFVLHHRTGFVAFANSCPHWNVDLDLGFGDFYDSADDRIFCRNHGALFLPTTGECTAGPCAGLFLERFAVELAGADVLVDTSPPLSVTNLLGRR
jgi:nitrite reductase/ring-hydroxylating ferredoxin subunit